MAINTRFTLQNSYGGTKVISEPGGQVEAVLKLERNLQYWCLVEDYSVPLLFYRSGAYDAGLDYIREIERAQGPDAQIRIRIDISHDSGISFDTLFDGLLDMETIKEIDAYKLECGIIRDDMWSKFMNRKSTPVDLKSTTDLDGDTISAGTSYTLSLPTQKIRQIFRGEFGNHDTLSDNITFTAVPNGDYVIVDFPNIVTDQINERFTYTPIQTPILPNEMFAVEFAGSYAFDIQIVLSGNIIGFIAPVGIDVFLQIGNAAPIAFTRTDTGTAGIDARSFYTYTGSATLAEAETIRIYMQNNNGLAQSWVWLEDDDGTFGYPSYALITADTVFIDTDCEAFTIFNSGKAILERTVGMDVLASGFLSSGCGSDYALTRGLNVRGYTLTEKPFFCSFDDWWTGINSILCLGLIPVGGSIIIEDIASIIVNSIVIENLSNVNKIERGYDESMIFNKVETGYEKWEAEASQGIDDPQTKRVYNTRYKTNGTEKQIFSKFLAASVAIEQTRRNRKEKNNDWKLDDDIFIIALNKSDPTQPEFDENFSAVTGLLNSGFRYNIRLSAARIMVRWRKFFNGCLHWFAGESYKFASGQGNFDMVSTLSGADCEYDGLALDEGGDIITGSDFLFTPITYTFEYPLTWNQYKAIRDNSTRSIGVSRTSSGHVTCIIKSLSYEVNTGRTKFVVWTTSTTDLL